MKRDWAGFSPSWMKTSQRDFRILDKDLTKLTHSEAARFQAARPLMRLGAAMLFVLAVVLVAMGVFGGQGDLATVGTAMAVASYLALSIGSNDVANSLGPAVGAGAVPLGAGLVIVALAEIAGALLGGDAVTYRMASGIIPPEAMQGSAPPARMMLAALMAAALWISTASLMSVPVSTTHSIVGAIAGAGLAAYGAGAVNWPGLMGIASGWVIAPLLAGLIAAATLALIQFRVNEAPDRIAAARLWLPALIAAMTGSFLLYATALLARLPMAFGLTVAVLGAALAWAYARLNMRDEIRRRSDERPGLKKLFSAPLLLAVTLMGFAHGANDVANIAGPLSVIVASSGISQGAGSVSTFILLAAGAGIATGTLLFGRRLVQMVGSGITRLNPVRAFCVSLATGTTVLGASWAGLPVSATHIAIGAVFGLGFFRETLDRRRQKTHEPMPIEERRRRRLVRRSHVVTILAAWIVTLPATGLLAALIFWLTGVTG